jgi:hypothetical protein
MFAFVFTLVLLGGLLAWFFAWQRGSYAARGIAVGTILVLVAGPVIRASASLDHLPIWAPALPFALIAVTLFGFGLLAWFWGEE